MSEFDTIMAEVNIHDYSSLLNAVKLVKQSYPDDKELICKAWETLSSHFPLNVCQCLEFIDQLKAISGTSEVINIFRSFVNDYLSPTVWKHYLTYAMEHDPVEFDAMCIKATEMTKYCYSEDSLAIFSMTMSFLTAKRRNASSNSEDFLSLQKMLLLEYSSIPWSSNEKLAADLQSLGSDVDDKYRQEVMNEIESTGRKSLHIAEWENKVKVEYERKDSGEWIVTTKPRFKDFLEYIESEMSVEASVAPSPSDIDRRRALFERAICCFPTSDKVWLLYLSYLENNNSPLPDIVAVVKRAVRNLPYNYRIVYRYIDLQSFGSKKEAEYLQSVLVNYALCMHAPDAFHICTRLVEATVNGGHPGESNGNGTEGIMSGEAFAAVEMYFTLAINNIKYWVSSSSSLMEKHQRENLLGDLLETRAAFLVAKSRSSQTEDEAKELFSQSMQLANRKYRSAKWMTCFSFEESLFPHPLSKTAVKRLAKLYQRGLSAVEETQCPAEERTTVVQYIWNKLIIGTFGSNATLETRIREQCLDPLYRLPITGMITGPITGTIKRKVTDSDDRKPAKKVKFDESTKPGDTVGPQLPSSATNTTGEDDRPPPDEERVDNGVFLSNLPRGVSEADVRAFVAAKVAPERIVSVRVVVKQRTTIAYVDLTDAPSKDACLSLDRCPLSGTVKRPVFVSELRPKSQVTTNTDGGVSLPFSTGKEKNKLFIRNIPKLVDEDEFSKFLTDRPGFSLSSSDGSRQSEFVITRIRLVRFKNGVSKGIAYVEMQTDAMAEKAVARLNDCTLRGVKINVAISDPPPKQPRPMPNEGPSSSRPDTSIPRRPPGATSSLGFVPVTVRQKPKEKMQFK